MFLFEERLSGDVDMRGSRVPGSRPMDDLSLAFEGSRKAVNNAIDMVCEFTGIVVTPFSFFQVFF